MSWDIQHGDCVELMAAMPEASVDAIVTDPPYGLEFMGREWDAIGRNVGPGGKRRDRETAIAARGDGWQPGSSYGTPAKNARCMKCGRLRFDHAERKCACELPAFHARASEYGEAMQEWHQAWSMQAWRVLKPGGHIVAFGGTRTFHRLACALEDAGFEIRDCLSWMYGSGFPKSLDVSKAIDKAAGAERTVVGVSQRHGGGQAFAAGAGGFNTEVGMLTAPATDAAQRWRGWGTALKPAWEPIILARKPLVGTVAANVQAHGTGALNVDGCRIGAGVAVPGGGNGQGNYRYGDAGHYTSERPRVEPHTSGRWPANVLLTHSEDCREADCARGCPVRMLDEQSGELRSHGGGTSSTGFWQRDDRRQPIATGDSGGASRFFYTAKASSGERHYAGRNAHPTVKPVDLMRWLCRLVTPPGGLVLDPFMGSGSTGIAALSEGFRFLGMEKDPDSVATARRRIAGPLFAEASP